MAFDMSSVMDSEYDVSANWARILVTLKGSRYVMAMGKKFEGKANIESREVPRLGTNIKGHKAGLVNLLFTLTIYKCTEIFDDVIEEYMRTGRFPRFDIQTSNEDPAVFDALGRSSKVYNNCIMDGDVLLSLADAAGGGIEQEISGYAENITRPEKLRNPAEM